MSDPFGELLWIDGDRGELLMPEPATFALVITGRETCRFSPDAAPSSFFQFAAPGQAILFVSGFNRIAFERRAGTTPMAL